MKEEPLKKEFFKRKRTNFKNVAIQIKATAIPLDKK